MSDYYEYLLNTAIIELEKKVNSLEDLIDILKSRIEDLEEKINEK